MQRQCTEAVDSISRHQTVIGTLGNHHIANRELLEPCTPGNKNTYMFSGDHLIHLAARIHTCS